MLKIPSMVALIIIAVTTLVAYKKRFGLTLALLVSNFSIFFVYTIYRNEMSFDLAFSPIYLYSYPEKLYTLATTMFLHADLSHILGNMITLFFLGIPFERRVGLKRFALIYFISGIGGTIIYSLVNPSPTFLIGASGAIFGILGAFAFAYPFEEVVMPLPFFFIAILTRVKVLYAAILFGLLELGFSLISYGYDNVAHVAHVGGLVTGILLSWIVLRERKVRIGIVEYRDLAEVTPDRELMDRIRGESIPEIRKEWIRELITKHRCPYCNGRLSYHDEGAYCRRCRTIFR